MAQKKIIEGLHPRGWSPLGPDLFLELSARIPVIDVRSPSEFWQGHIPGAYNLPLFDDDERAIVGTEFSRSGKADALLTGLEIVGPKLKFFTETALHLAHNGEILVHCWRGGMRSEAMAWLFCFAGLKTGVLAGGYKAYRKFIRESFNDGPQLIVIGGMTGSGKTDLLKFLDEQGEQALDLEALASHKGSAFGAMGQEEQPTNEQFENNLAGKWLSFAKEKPVWTEDESRNIGKVIIPDSLFDKIAKAEMVYIEVPFDERVSRLVEEYGQYERTELKRILGKISRRIGGDNAANAITAVERGNVGEAVAIVLRYYDMTYSYGLAKRGGNKILTKNYAEVRREFAKIRRGLEL